MQAVKLIRLRYGVYLLESGIPQTQISVGNVLKVKFGCVETKWNGQEVDKASEICLPVALEERNLDEVDVAYDMTYKVNKMPYNNGFTEHTGTLTPHLQENVRQMMQGEIRLIEESIAKQSTEENMQDVETVRLSIIKLASPGLPQSDQVLASPVDIRPQTADSTYDEVEYDGETMSVTSEIEQGVWENGRRYHAFEAKHRQSAAHTAFAQTLIQAAAYNLPEDEREQDRLNCQAEVIRLALDEALYLAPIEGSLMEILDLGAGICEWASRAADSYPAARVHGVDLSIIPQGLVPRNLSLLIDDVETPWSFPPNHFDLIHTCTLAGAIASWAELFQRSLGHLKPGAWMEIQEVDLYPHASDGSSHERSFLRKWCEKQEKAARKAEVSVRVSGEAFRDQMTCAGFVDVTVRKIDIPIGDWPEDSKMKELGRLQLKALLSDPQGWTMRFWTRYLHMDRESVELFLIDLRKELKRTGVFTYHWPLYIVYGRKPK